MHRSDLDGNWYVRGYENTRQALLDPRMGKPRRLPYRYGMDRDQLERTYRLRRPSMLFSNGADHTRQRTPGRSTFLPSRMEQFRAWVVEVANGLLALFRHPDQMAGLWSDDDPDRLANAVEEMLRYDSPVQSVAHLTLADMEIGGHHIPAGETVIFMLAAANHDPARFVDPDRFITSRPDGGAHVSFAWGAHHCLGAPLARLEGHVVFSRLRERFSRLELLDYDPPRRPDPLFRTLTSLPVRFFPR